MAGTVIRGSFGGSWCEATFPIPSPRWLVQTIAINGYLVASCFVSESSGRSRSVDPSNALNFARRPLRSDPS